VYKIPETMPTIVIITSPKHVEPPTSEHGTMLINNILENKNNNASKRQKIDIPKTHSEIILLRTPITAR
jgi:hypothetical protein